MSLAPSRLGARSNASVANSAKASNQKKPHPGRGSQHKTKNHNDYIISTHPSILLDADSTGILTFIFVHVM